MELSKKQKHLSQFFVALLKYALSFEHFEKKMKLIAYVSTNLQTAKKVVRQKS